MIERYIYSIQCRLCREELGPRFVRDQLALQTFSTLGELTQHLIREHGVTVEQIAKGYMKRLKERRERAADLPKHTKGIKV